ncbi:MAG TPA: CBS domain-containing protein [Dissulfurispiraceae bacterium]|nr:CBS domain-containing protein [Dissulfurispiraceae bacterium]
MTRENVVKDLMVSIFDYPHVPYWFSIGQAVQLIKMSVSGQGDRLDPVVILVFDEKYNLVGTAGRNELLKGLGPDSWNSESAIEEQSEAFPDMSEDFLAEARERAERPVSEVMASVKYFVQPDDSVTRAAFLMARHNLLMLPVLEGKKKFVGLVRIADVFDDFASVTE